MAAGKVTGNVAGEEEEEMAAEAAKVAEVAEVAAARAKVAMQVAMLEVAMAAGEDWVAEVEDVVKAAEAALLLLLLLR